MAQNGSINKELCDLCSVWRTDRRLAETDEYGTWWPCYDSRLTLQDCDKQRDWFDWIVKPRPHHFRSGSADAFKLLADLIRVRESERVRAAGTSLAYLPYSISVVTSERTDSDYVPSTSFSSESMPSLTWSSGEERPGTPHPSVGVLDVPEPRYALAYQASMVTVSSSSTE